MTKREREQLRQVIGLLNHPDALTDAQVWDEAMTILYKLARIARRPLPDGPGVPYDRAWKRN